MAALKLCGIEIMEREDSDGACPHDEDTSLR
jgi:hypothetical protein